MASSFVVCGTRASVRNDLLGIQPLFFLEHENAVYFSNWLPILSQLSATRTPDREGWASILVLGFALPGASPFVEVRSLSAGASLEVVNGRAAVGQSELNIPSDWIDESASLLSAVRDGIPRDGRSSALTLSGGWDSRLLLALAAEGQLSTAVDSWTTSTDDGTDLDLSLAHMVAEHLKTRHHEVVPDVDRWVKGVETSLQRFHHSTWVHSWLEPLSAELRSRNPRIIDGLGGDVLIKGLYQEAEDDWNGQSVQARQALWRRLGGWTAERDDCWSQDALSLFGTLRLMDLMRRSPR
jgi:hypothetical protein